MNKLLKLKLTTIILFSLASSSWGFGIEGLKQQAGDAEADLSALSEKHIGNPDSIAMGRQLFGNTCLFCHGAEGIGARAPSLVTGAYRPGGGNTPEYMYSVIINGRPGTIMGSFRESHTDEQIWQILAFLRDKSANLASQK